MNKFLEKVKANAKTEVAPKKKKSSVPELQVPEEVRKSVDNVCEVKKIMKEKKAELSLHEVEVIDFCRGHQDKEGLKGNYSTSYRVFGTNGNAVTYVTGNKFSLSPADQSKIEGLLGTSYNDMINEEYQVTLKKSVLQDEVKMKKLMKLVGDEFDEFFESKLVLATKAGFDEKIYKVVKNKKKLEEVRTFVKPYKASLKA